MYNGGMKRETTWGRGCDRWDHEHEVRGRSLTLGIQHYPHGRGNDVVESMDVIGHGKESPWGGLVKFFQCAGYIGGLIMKVEYLVWTGKEKFRVMYDEAAALKYAARVKAG